MSFSELNTPRLDEYFGILAFHEGRLQKLVDQVNQPGWLTGHMENGQPLRHRGSDSTNGEGGFESREEFSAHLARMRSIDSALPGVRYYDYSVTTSGIAIIDLEGSLMKHSTSFGGSSYIRVRQMLRHAVRNQDVKAILLRVDSPGGTVSGCHDLAADIRAAMAVKPVHTYGEDLVASAALWCGVQASFMSVGPTACIGSIGVFMSVVDFSKSAEDEGLKVIKITTGPLKGAGVPGTVITEAQIAEWQARVNDYYGHFLDAVSMGCSMARAKVQELATGACWVGTEAVKVGLADAVESFDEAMERIEKAASNTTSSPTGKAIKQDTTEASETTETKTENSPMAAATYDQLKEAFPNASSDFLTDQLDQKADMETANGNYRAHLELQLEESKKRAAATDKEKSDLESRLEVSKEVGDTGVDTSINDKPADKPTVGNAKSQFQSLVKEKLAECGGDREQAAILASQENPTLHEAFVTEINSQYSAGKDMHSHIGNMGVPRSG